MSSPCLNLGTCVDDIDGYKCVCMTGYAGNLCEKSELKTFGFFILNDTWSVSVCECYLPGSVSENCNLTTGQCLCRDGADGQNCDTCILSQKPFANITECLGKSRSDNCKNRTVLFL